MPRSILPRHIRCFYTIDVIDGFVYVGFFIVMQYRETCFRLVDVSSVFSVLDGGQRTEVRGHVLG